MPVKIIYDGPHLWDKSFAQMTAADVSTMLERVQRDFPGKQLNFEVCRTPIEGAVVFYITAPGGIQFDLVMGTIHPQLAKLAGVTLRGDALYLYSSKEHGFWTGEFWDALVKYLKARYKL